MRNRKKWKTESVSVDSRCRQGWAPRPGFSPLSPSPAVDRESLVLLCLPLGDVEMIGPLSLCE